MPKPTAKKKSSDKPVMNPIMARYWREIERYDRAVTDWHHEGSEIEDIYLDGARSARENTRRFALLWANVQTLQPAVYGRLPQVVCSRRYKDKDPIGRIAAELMERSSNTSLDLYRVNETFKMVRDDRLISGRGQAWVRYEAMIEKTERAADVEEGEEPDPEAEPQYDEKLKAEKVCADYVHWKDFGHSVARTWNDVWLVWRVVYKTQEEVAERFGGDVASGISYNAKAPAYGAGKASDDPEDRAKVYECWDKMRGLVSWMVQGNMEFLESGEPPVNFRDFFPCPEPTYATKTSKELIPVPDYRYYRDQAKEINDLTDKIGRLSEWLVVKGFIPGAPSSVADPIEEIIREKGNRELFVQVDDWTSFTEKGGAAKLIDWLPIEAVAKTLQIALQTRQALIQDVFQLTGISDILRGQTNPNETLGAQELKAQTGSRRLQSTKDDIARFCRDVAALMAEAIAELFSPQSIADITGYKYQPTPPQQPMLALPSPGMAMPVPGGQPGMTIIPPAAPPRPPMFGGAQMGVPGGTPFGSPGPSPFAPPMAPQAMPFPMGHNGGPEMGMNEMGGDLPPLTFDDRVMALLRNDKLRSFRIEVETDITSQADENSEKQRRMEFLTSVGGYLDKAVLIMKQAPALGEVVRELLLFTARSFRTGRQMEDVLDRGFTAAIKQAEQAMQAASQQPPPELMVEKLRLQNDTAIAAADRQTEVQIADADRNAEMQDHAADRALSAQEHQTGAVLEKRQQDIDHSKNVVHERTAAAAQAQDRAQRMLERIRPPVSRMQ